MSVAGYLAVARRVCTVALAHPEAAHRKACRRAAACRVEVLRTACGREGVHPEAVQRKAYGRAVARRVEVHRTACGLAAARRAGAQ